MSVYERPSLWQNIVCLLLSIKKACFEFILFHSSHLLRGLFIYLNFVYDLPKREIKWGWKFKRLMGIILSHLLISFRCASHWSKSALWWPFVPQYYNTLQLSTARKHIMCAMTTKVAIRILSELLLKKDLLKNNFSVSDAFFFLYYRSEERKTNDRPFIIYHFKTPTMVIVTTEETCKF